MSKSEKDINGSSNFKHEKMLEGHIYITDYYASPVEIEGNVNIKSINDSSDFAGTMYIPVERSAYLNSTIEIYYEANSSYLDGQLYINNISNYTDLKGKIDIPSIRKKELKGLINIPYFRDENILNGQLYIPNERYTHLNGSIQIQSYQEENNIPGTINIKKYEDNQDLDGSLYIKYQSTLDGSVIVKVNIDNDIAISVIVPYHESDIEGTVNVLGLYTYDDFDISITVPYVEVDIPGAVIVKRYYFKDPFEINVRVPINVNPESYEPIVGDYIIEIPWPYPQFTDMEFILTEVKYPNGMKPPKKSSSLLASLSSPDNLFIPRRYYERYDENHLLLSDELGLQEGDEIRFTFFHNDSKFQIQKLEFYFKAQGNASFYYLNMISPYKKRIDQTDIQFLIFVNRRLVLLNKDYTIDNETGILEFINDDLAQSTDDRIDVVCFFTGIDDTAVANLPMSGYIYLKRNMIDRNYNNNLMATFINGKLVPRDKILHISNNIYKIKEDIKTRHDLQILNMSNRIDCMVPFYKQATQYPPFDKYSLFAGTIYDYDRELKVIETAFNIIITVPEKEKMGRQHLTYYQNPVYFSPQFLLENKDMYISFIHYPSQPDLEYYLTFYDDDYSALPTEKMKVTLELHIKTPFEETKEESRSTILLFTLPYRVTAVYEEYCYACLQIKQIINLDIWNNRFLESCDGISIRIEPNRTYQDQPSEVYFEMFTNKFEDFEKEQITVFEYRITNKYDGLGDISYSKFITFNPEEYYKEEIKEAENARVD